jgi:hypothetical protein
LLVFAALALVPPVAFAQTAANCPFNVDQSSAANSRRATTDGLIFVRYALGLPSTTPVVANATENAALTSAQVAAHMATNAAALDIDGDGKFSTFDAQIIARYLVGFRGTTLAAGLNENEFAKRYGGTELQSYIETGCNPGAPSTDPRIIVWNAMNTAMLANNPTTANTYLTEGAKLTVGASLTQLAPTYTAIYNSYSPLIPGVVRGDYAEYWVSRPVLGSTTGERNLFVVIFLQLQDGSWKIDSM